MTKFYANFVVLIICIAVLCYGIRFQSEAMTVFSLICATINASIWSVCEAIITPIETTVKQEIVREEGEDE